MAIPIRLLAGLGNEIEIDLVAQSIDMSVDRNVSAFPTPDNYLKRFAIDTNIPRVKIDINGIFVDDAGIDTIEEGGKGYPAATMINCASILPTIAGARHSVVAQATSQAWSLSAGYTGVASSGVVLGHSNTIYSAFHSLFDQPIGTVSTIIASGIGNYELREELNEDWVDAEGGVVPTRLDLTDIKGRIQINLKFDGGHSAGIAPTALNVKSSLEYDGSVVPINDTTAPDIGAQALLHPGARIIKSDGTFLGIIASLTDASITFEQNLASAISDSDEIYANAQIWNERGEFVGFVDAVYDDETIPVGNAAKWYIELIGQNEAGITQGAALTINEDGRGRWDSLLDNEKIKIIPSYWLEDPYRNPKHGKCLRDSEFVSGSNHIGVRLIFDGNTDYTTAPTITEGATGESRHLLSYFNVSKDAKYFDAVINVPVKDIIDADASLFADEADKLKYANPAVALASQIQAALQLEVSMVASTYNSKSVRITNSDGTYTYSNQLDDTFSVQRSGPVVIIKQKYIPDNSLEHPEVMGAGLRNKFFVEVFSSSNGMDLNVRKSAGDKVQDLIGIVSNAGKLTDLLRGIQIPYDSLVTSSGVTGVARNFFLTFGEIPITEKGSLANERASSLTMDELLLHDDWGGNSPDKGKRNIFDKLVDAVIPDDIQALSGWLVGAAKDMWVTLDTPAHGNAGGIRIIPERLHVRYDAGNNYYAFNLELIASDFVIGV